MGHEGRHFYSGFMAWSGIDAPVDWLKASAIASASAASGEGVALSAKRV